MSTLTRRDLLRSGLACCVATCATGHPAAAFGQSRQPRRIGCMLAKLDAERLFGRSTEQRLYATGRESIVMSSGDKTFDTALAMTLSRISDEMQVLPGFAFYDDTDGENAYATQAKRLQNADGTVLFGTRYLKRLLALPENPDVAVAAVCAHEFGHIVQYKLGLIARIDPADDKPKRAELQADFFAGYYSGVRKRERQEFPAAVFALTQYNAGDNMVNDPDHHGTPDERGAAISRGFEAAYRQRQSFSDAIEASVAYVKGL